MAHHKEQNMAGCCMSIYDIWRGHVRYSITPRHRGTTVHIAPIFFAISSIDKPGGIAA